MGFKVVHIGVAVQSIDAAMKSLVDLFGYKVSSGPFDDPIQKVRVIFLSQNETDVAEIELIAPLSEDSPVQSMLKKGQGGAYHLCVQTDDIEAAVALAASKGCVIVSKPVPAVAFGGRRIAWLYTPVRQLFELVETKEPAQTCST